MTSPECMKMTEMSSQAIHIRTAAKPVQTASTASVLVSMRKRWSAPTLKTNQAKGPNRATTPLTDQNFVQLVRLVLHET